jgi:hypothetical protein
MVKERERELLRYCSSEVFRNQAHVLLCSKKVLEEQRREDRELKSESK